MLDKELLYLFSYVILIVNKNDPYCNTYKRVRISGFSNCHIQILQQTGDKHFKKLMVLSPENVTWMYSCVPVYIKDVYKSAVCNLGKPPPHTYCCVKV